MPVESSACLSATIEERVRRTIANAPQTRVSRAPSNACTELNDELSDNIFDKFGMFALKSAKV